MRLSYFKLTLWIIVIVYGLKTSRIKDAIMFLGLGLESTIYVKVVKSSQRRSLLES